MKNKEVWTYFIGGLVALSLIIILPVALNIILVMGSYDPIFQKKLKFAVKLTILVLFLILGCAFVALMVKLFIWGQIKIGNEKLWLVQFLKNNERRVIYGWWIFYALGFLIALPTILKSELFQE